VRPPTVICLLILLIACSNRTGIPKGIIQPDSMQVILKDVIMADQFSSFYLVKDTLKRDKVKNNQDLLEAIFKIHHISKESFHESLLFYESRPDLNKKIFDSLSVYANRRRIELYAPKPVTKPGARPAK
jgi:Domain of unknown function (DUF4296)